jgi:hypothetical protein
MKILNSVLKLIDKCTGKVVAKELDVKDPNEKDLKRILAKNEKKLPFKTCGLF